MKVLLCLSVLIAVAVAENCTALTHCSMTTCTGTGWEKHCYDNHCLCTHNTITGHTCSDDTGCSSPGDNPCRHHIGPVYFQMKCVRGSCHCAVDYHHVFPGHGSHGNWPPSTGKPHMTPVFSGKTTESYGFADWVTIWAVYLPKRIETGGPHYRIGTDCAGRA